MKRRSAVQALRSLRPEATRGWADSDEGRDVLRSILSEGGPEMLRESGEAGPGEGHRRRSRVLVGAAGLVVVVVIAAVGLVNSQLLAGRDGAVRTALDTHRASDIKFFQQLDVTVSALTESYPSLEAAARAASVVVVADVVDIRVGHGVGPSDDRFYTYYLVLHPSEVLVGELREQDEDELVVMFPAGAKAPKDKVEQMRGELPKGQSVWFLRSGADIYSQMEAQGGKQGDALPRYAEEQRAAEKKGYIVVSPEGLLVQGADGVVTPLADSNGTAMGGRVGQDARSYGRLSELVVDLRAVKGWNGNKPDPRNG